MLQTIVPAAQKKRRKKSDRKGCALAAWGPVCKVGCLALGIEKRHPAVFSDKLEDGAHVFARYTMSMPVVTRTAYVRHPGKHHAYELPIDCTGIGAPPVTSASPRYRVNERAQQNLPDACLRPLSWPSTPCRPCGQAPQHHSATDLFPCTSLQFPIYR